MDTPEIKNQAPETKPETKCKCGLPGCKCKSKALVVSATALGIIILMLGSFAAGVGVGIRKAKFSSDWGKNYERNFMGAGSGMGKDRPGSGGIMGQMMRGFEGRDFRNAHGVAGTIISIADKNIIVKDKDNKENTVAVTDKTIIKNGRNDVQLSDLKQDDQIVVMGNPGDNGVVNADLIRVFPSVQNTN
jgi:hypothetical protein